MQELTFNEEMILNDRFDALCEYVAWVIAKNYHCEDKVDYIEKLFRIKTEVAAISYKSENVIKNDIKFTSYIKEAIWNFQKRLSKALREQGVELVLKHGHVAALA